MSWRVKGTYSVTIAQATRPRMAAFGLEFDHTGKNGHSAPFSWAV